MHNDFYTFCRRAQYIRRQCSAFREKDINLFVHRYLAIGTQEEPADDTGDAKMIAADDQAEDNDDKPLKGRLAGEARAQVVQDRRDAGNHDDGLLCLRTCHHPGAN